jgi:hypothetical protein
VGFLGLWCHDVAEVVSALHKLVVEGIAGVEFGCAAEVVEVDWRSIDAATDRVEALASDPAREGSRWCTGAL